MSTELSAAPGAPSVRSVRFLGPLASVVAALAFVLLLGAAGPAGAAGQEPGLRIADGLRKSPVYVDPSYRDAFPADQQRRLAKKIKASGIPVRVIVIPFVSGDPWGGEPEKMVDVVRDRLGESRQKEAVYMTLSRTEGFLNGYEFPHNGRHQAFWGVAAVGHQDDMEGKSLYTKFSRALEIVKAGNGNKQYERATKDLRKGDTPSADGDEADGGPSPLLLAALIVPALAVLVAAVLVLRARRLRTSTRAPFTPPRSVFATARKANVRDLRKRAQRELLAYNEELLAHEPGDSGEDADTELLQLSLDAYAAAGTVLDGARDVPDLAGVLALLHEGRDALRRSDATGAARSTAALPLCFFHPLHGPAAERVRWRPLGRRESLDVAACAECAAAVAARRAPEVLTQTHEDRPVPYFEVPPADSLWAATGYGSLTEDTLTERVLRGDFSRTR
ncbi:hypothetical protein ITI46_30320 [Streptomyces oryzae]|uniref:TPM domain-containing protein n=1 Tax=Streptomyces oryzae TaxID=1434886 RepID=A0ABS3XKJ7_9ACTN|nr:hypothetical protein [Streptomyces oryzae]MBO8195911.1 hypothetical protein [Streptomyces oryzae]